jgi:uncharacterized RDD family membrane protein YckC
VLLRLGLPLGTRFLLSTVGGLLYNGLLDGGPDGQTLGKRVLRIRVVDADTGELIGPQRGIGRATVPSAFGLMVVSPFLLPVGFVLAILNGLWPLWDGRRQTFHDKVVRSAVVVA